MSPVLTAASIPPFEEIATGVYVLGGVEPIDERISWIASDGGLVPMNVYAIVSGNHALLVDTGVRAHEQALADALADLLPGEATVEIALTRAVELETIGNVEALVRSRHVTAVYSHFPSVSWVFTADPLELDDPARATRCVPYPEHRSIAVARRRLSVLEPVLRLLQTTWLYEEESGTLFTSDAFGWIPARTDAASRILDVDLSSNADVAAGMGPKFGWLQTADVRETRDAVESLFSNLDVQAVAPTIGCVLRGRETVRAHVALVLDVLDKWGGSSGN
jgi:flavorubredoxin